MKLLITFFLFAYAISWLIWLPLYGPAFGLDNLPVLPYHHALGGLGPMIAAIITTAVYEKQAGLRKLLLKCLQWKPFLYLMIALFSPFILAVIAVLVARMVNNIPLEWASLFPLKNFRNLIYLHFLFIT